MEKRWVLKTTPDQDTVSSLAKRLLISETLATVLCQRGVCNFEEAKKYFRPSLDDLHDPFLIRDMDKAIDRLNEAIHQNEKVLIYGDYDVDGTTSVALVYSFLQRYVKEIDIYIPNRDLEGYGISVQGVDWAAEHNFTLVISLDCGIKSMEKVAYAKSKGIDFIICDHHLPDTTIPDAVAVLDPKRSDCPYPYKELSGCGVGFKLLQGFCQHNDLDTAPLFGLLDLLVVSIAADIVPITGENRIFAYFGLQQLNSGAPLRPGLEALRELAGLTGELDINSIVFGFAPRINAAGRMGDAKRSVHMLLAPTKEEAFTKADIIDKTNNERRGHDTSITKEALLMIEQDEVMRRSRSTVLFKETWHKGVVGIVASRCIEKYYRPTIILTQSNGKASGSARSVHGFDVHSAILECSDLLEQFGGHMYAAGLTLPVENIPAFRERFEAVVSRTITEEQLIPQIEIDTPIRLRQITPNFLKIVKQMEPFGPGNMGPVFMSECVYDTGACRVVGETHLKLKIMQEDSHQLDAIAFGMADYYPRILKGIPFDVCYCVEENVYRGVTSLQLRIKDIRFAE
ncbi:single-stranded-DNA-specific exonuclease RecJ [Adhaeribacter rhizoryzae]|uniref:Single-stranded-DNA-specific exonuclease RecJ n=1 Tax=Adhaeribacter rhizoryzae TaxID=2607907 RepID=A0A5M6DJ33_9BACT|nr:single-stranded-DNA-specific exonuclease RecJ [Adhaeribacter rhizoryzae]KAA5546386.1 single-stranded-DNA-specific exonuclease RecJ [Adhaeribacter rhizoryzae]